MLLHLEKVVAEVEDVEASVLSKEGNDHAASPVEAVSEALPGKQERQRVSNQVTLEILCAERAWSCTHSTVNSWVPTGMQYTNCMALHKRWNSTHSSTCITPLLGSGPRQMGSSKKPRTRVRMTSNMDRPQHSLSLVRRSPSRAMAIC